MNDEQDIFEPYEKLVEIEIGGEKFLVPENNSLLRCFQYLDSANISMGDFCWNGDCANCQVWLGGKDSEKAVLACRTKVWDKMEIRRMSRDIKLLVKKM